MKKKKLITGLLFLLFFAILIYQFISLSDNNIVVFIFLGTFISLTYLIHLFSFDAKLAKRMKKIWFILLSLFILQLLLNIFTPLSDSFLSIFFMMTILVFFFITSLYLIEASRKTDLVILILMSLSFIGLIFKHYHLPGGGPLMVLGWAFPAILILFIFYIKITEYDARTNKFLEFFKNVIAGTIALCLLGATFKIQHWPGGNLLNRAGFISLILSVLFVVFLLPNSNFIEWTKQHKQMFYRALLVPLLYLTLLNTLAYVFPDTFRKMMFSQEYNITNGYGFKEYPIPPKEGL